MPNNKAAAQLASLGIFAGTAKAAITEYTNATYIGPDGTHYGVDALRDTYSGPDGAGTSLSETFVKLLDSFYKGGCNLTEAAKVPFQIVETWYHDKNNQTPLVIFSRGIGEPANPQIEDCAISKINDAVKTYLSNENIALGIALAFVAAIIIGVTIYSVRRCIQERSCCSSPGYEPIEHKL